MDISSEKMSGREIINDATTGRGPPTEEIRKKTRDALLDPAVHRFRGWGATL